MRYLCLVYIEKEDWFRGSDFECGTYAKKLTESGHMSGGAPLHPVETATTLRMKDGQLSITDGPFAETKEMLAGYWMLEANDLNEAIRIAKDIPTISFGSLEIRPVRELNFEF